MDKLIALSFIDFMRLIETFSEKKSIYNKFEEMESFIWL
jgi:hypothetical protein